MQAEINTLDNEAIRAPSRQFVRGDVLAGRFEVLRLLGRGGMGEVYEASDRMLDGSRVAIKTLLSENAMEREARLRLKSELLLARQVTHPNVCPIYDLYECEEPVSICFLSMKLLGGETLARRLRRAEVLSKTEKQLIAQQLCGALRAAHQAGVVHRDLKPGNVMLEGSGLQLKATVTDFGIALEYEPDRTVKATRHVAGTPGYIAPEVRAGEPATPESDLYSLGVVLHEVFAGQKPMTPPGQTRTRSADTKKMPLWCFRLVTGCLDSNTAVRARAFKRALEYLGVERRGAKEAFEGWSISRRTLLTMSAAVAASVMGGGLLEREGGLENLLHPLPRKRFVAVIQYPSAGDTKVAPLVTGVLDAIESELSRAEAFDRDLYVTGGPETTDSDKDALQAVQNSSGVNLALAAQGSLVGDSFVLVLKLLDCATDAAVRVRKIVTSQADIQVTVREAVAAAAELLNVHLRSDGVPQPSLATDSEQAYRLFQTAEDLIKQPNDTGLDKALENYRAALEADPKYAVAYAKLALAYTRFFSLHGDVAALDLARRNAESGLKFDPNLVAGYVALSSYYDYSGNQKAALTATNKALALDPTNPHTLYIKAQIFWRTNRWADAEQIYQRILEQRPNYWLAYNELGCVLESQGRYKEALTAFRMETVVNPRSYYGFGNLGDVNFKLGNAEAAQQNYKQSLKLKPNELAYTGLGMTLRSEGHFGTAVPYLLKAAEANPSNDENWLNLGDCYESLHRSSQARTSYLRAKQAVEEVLARDASDSGAWIRLALYSKKTGQPGDPLLLVKKGKPSDSMDLDTQVILTRIFELVGNRKAAMATLGKCFQRGLTSREITFIPDFQALQKDPSFEQISQRQ